MASRYRVVRQSVPEILGSDPAQKNESQQFFLEGSAQLEGVRGRIHKAEARLRDLQRLMHTVNMAGAALRLEATFARLHLFVQRDTTRALRVLDAALASDAMQKLPAVDRSYTQFAEVYAVAGKPERARELLNAYEREVLEEQADRGDSQVQTIKALIALSRGDPDVALAAERSAISMEPCPICDHSLLGLIFDRSAQVDSALAHYEAYVSARVLDRLWSDALLLPPILERTAQLHDQRGNIENALSYYTRFVELWENADAELQPRVRAARQRLAELLAKRG